MFSLRGLTEKSMSINLVIDTSRHTLIHAPLLKLTCEFQDKNDNPKGFILVVEKLNKKLPVFSSIVGFFITSKLKVIVTNSDPWDQFIRENLIILLFFKSKSFQ